MISAWTKHLPNESEKDKFKSSLQGSKIVMERLQDLLKEEAQTLDRTETDIKTFDNPNWAFVQSYKNGYRACLDRIIKLTNLDQG